MVGQSTRAGFSTITPYLMVQDVEAVVAFLTAAFGAVELFRATGGAGGTHVEVKIGDSMLMLGGGGAATEQKPVALFLYVEAVDTVYEAALRAGAKTVMKPADGLFAEQRGAGVVDPFGNQWFLARH